MSIKLTSIAAYRELKDNGKEYTQAARIINIVAKRANMSLQEIMRQYRARFGNIELSSVSARVNKLKYDEILICEMMPRKCVATGRFIHAVRINEAVKNERVE